MRVRKSLGLRIKFTLLKLIRTLDPINLVECLRELRRELIIRIESRLAKYEAELVIEEILSSPRGFRELRYVGIDELRSTLSMLGFKTELVRDVGVGYEVVMSRLGKYVHLIRKVKARVTDSVSWDSVVRGSSIINF